MASEQERAHQLDEVIFSVASSGALAVATYTVCAATNLSDLGMAGVVLVAVGAAASWWLRRWPFHRALPVGVLLGALAGLLWLTRVNGALGGLEEGYDLGLSLSLRMTLLLVAASYVLLRAELAALALVPGLSVMGLAAGQGDESLARAGFTVYLPLALLAVGYAMLMSGSTSAAAPQVPEPSAGARGVRSWRVRHWPTLAGAIAAIMLSAHALYYPIQTWAEEHRWRIITAVAAPGLPSGIPFDFMRDSSSYRIGMGPVDLSETPVLTITGGYAPYWRGEVYDRYLGNAWGQSSAGGIVEEFAAVPPSGRLVFRAPARRQRSASYRVTANADLPLIFYAPGEVCDVVLRGWHEVSHRSRVVMTGYGVARIRGQTLRTGSSYEVTAASMESPVGRPHVSKPPDQDYLALPLEVSQTGEVARRVAGNEPTPQRKMAALTGYLQERCTYSLEAPAVPPGKDAVEYFLFEGRVGYCDLFASALAVMGRAVGVPTRLVTGYAFPGPAPEGAQGEFVLSEADAHAWVEAFFPGSGGWTTLDPTPAAAPETPDSWLQIAAANLRQLWRDSPVLAAAYGVFALVLAFLFAVAVRSLHPRRLRAARRLVAGDWRAEMARVYLRLCHLLRRRASPRHASQTPLEYLGVLEEVWAGKGLAPAALPLVRALTEGFVAARYRPEPVSEAEAQAAQETLAAVQQALRARRNGVA